MKLKKQINWTFCWKFLLKTDIWLLFCNYNNIIFQRSNQEKATTLTDNHVTGYIFMYAMKMNLRSKIYVKHKLKGNGAASE